MIDIAELSYLERYCNGGTKDYSPHAAYTEALSAYRPESEVPSFALPTFLVPRKEINLYLANPSESLARHYLKDDHVEFCVHPQLFDVDLVDPYLDILRRFAVARSKRNVSPTASTRTLSVLDLLPEHALKVHFPFQVSRYGRKMRDEVIEQAINVSRELEREEAQLDDRFAFLREVIGMSLPDLNPHLRRSENWGFLVRDMQPWPLMDGHVRLIPGFALFGHDLWRNARPLLVWLIGESDPLEYVLENVMLPIIRQWIGCFLAFGYLLEPHAQNVLFEIDEDDSVRRVVHRDLSVGIDMRRRRELGLSEDSLNAYNRMEDGLFHSITYDKFMGHHFFDRLASLCLAHWPGLTLEDFRAPCRIEFARLFPNRHRYMPETVQYFSEQRDCFDKPLYRQTGQLPVWR